MNTPSIPSTEHDRPVEETQQINEIPSYPGAQAEEQPQQYQETAPSMPAPKVETTPAKPEQLDTYNQPEAQIIPQSQTPELQTELTYQTREGERIFKNPNLGQSTFRGGVTSQQLVSKVAGYYTVNQGLVSDPKAGLLQQTATSGDPTNGTTLQAMILFKILQAFWNILGVN